MPIPTAPKVKYDLIDPTSYPGSGSYIYNIGTQALADLNIYGSPTYNSQTGSLSFTSGSSEAYAFPSQFANITSTFTFNYWVQINNLSTDATIVLNGSVPSGGPYTGIQLYYNASSQKFGYNFIAVQGSDFTMSNVTLNKWYQVSVVANGSTIKCYVDGTLTDTFTYAPYNSFTSNSYLGFPGGTGLISGGDCSVGLLEIYDIELNSTEILAEYVSYSNRFNPPVHAYDAADPASYPGSGTTLTDIGSGTSIPLTINNATFDNVNDSFKLSGSLSSSIRSAEGLATQIGIGTNNFSYQLWFQYNGNVNLNGPIDIQLQVGSRGAGTYGGCNITTNSGQIIIESPGVGQLSTGFYPTNGQWYLLSLTVNSGNLTTLYVDGISVYSGTQSYGALNSLASIALGPSITSLGDTNKSGFGPLQIYNRELTNTEITNYYNSTKLRFITLLAEYDFGNGSYSGSGTTVVDLSGNGNDLTFPNGLTYTTTYGGEATLTSSQTSNLIGSYPNNLPQGSDVHTMVLWGKYTSTYNVGMFANGGASPAGARIDLGYAFGSRLGGEIYGVGFQTDIADTPAIGDWFQFVCVKPSFDPTETQGDLVLYYNGNLTGTTIVTGPATIDINSTGPIPNSAPGLAINWIGSPGDMAIIKAAIYSGAWTSTEVTADYADFQARLNPTPPPPIHSYDAADPASYPGSGTTLTDIGTASPINLTINNATYDNVTDTFALAGTNTSYIRSAEPVNIGIGGNDFSVQYWFKYNGLTGQPPYNIYLQVGERGAGHFSGFNHNTYNGEVNVQKPGVADYSTGWFPTIGTWYQVTMTVDASDNMIFYVDGVNTYSTTTSFTAPTGVIDSISIGTPITTIGDCVANVDFGPLFIYDRVLSSTEVTNYYNSTASRFNPPPPPYAGNVGGRTFGQGFAG